MTLPNEDDLVSHIRTELAVEFDLATELLGMGVRLFDSPAIDTPNVPGYDEIGVCFGVIAKACKQFRAVIGLAEIGLGDVAAANCRMLFETSIAAQFLMRDAVRLRRGKSEVPDVPDYPLTTAFRAQLYLANDAMNQAKTLRGLAASGGAGGGDDGVAVKAAEAFADGLCALLGTEWTDRLKRSGSFAGVNIFDLAESLDWGFVYAAFYRPASQGVHGTDARKSADIRLEGDGRVSIRFPTTSNGVAGAMKMGSQAFLDVLQITSLRFGLGVEERTRALRQRVQRMKEG